MGYRDEEGGIKAELIETVLSKILRRHTAKDCHSMQQKKRKLTVKRKG